MNPLQPERVQELFAARRRVTATAWLGIAERARAQSGTPTDSAIARIVGEALHADHAWTIRRALARCGFQTWNEIAIALEIVDSLASEGANPIDFIWSGPSSGAFPVRRIDQVLYDLITTARRRIFLVTFAAYRVPILCQHLATAIERGIAVTLLLESEEASAGQLNFDAAHAFRDLTLDKVRLLYWPLDKRQRNQAGKPGKLHVKCAIIDDTVVTGSANLTDDAFNRNMELGVVIKSPDVAARLVTHFEGLRGNHDLKVLDKPD